MAANLLKAGLPVVVFDRNPAAVEKLARLGATTAASPKAMAETPGVCVTEGRCVQDRGLGAVAVGQRLPPHAPIHTHACCPHHHSTGVTTVISMLPSTEHVADAFEGPQGLLKAEGGLHPSLLIDCSTILPTYTQALAASIATHALLAPGARRVPGSEGGPVFVDAPVSGGVPGAVAASLTFMVSVSLMWRGRVACNPHARQRQLPDTTACAPTHLDAVWRQ
jgi:3-hydroxyisobutyrate dehydrogenase-like beta-hydroxyacid dehydrogenase